MAKAKARAKPKYVTCLATFVGGPWDSEPKRIACPAPPTLRALDYATGEWTTYELRSHDYTPKKDERKTALYEVSK